MIEDKGIVTMIGRRAVEDFRIDFFDADHLAVSGCQILGSFWEQGYELGQGFGIGVGIGEDIEGLGLSRPFDPSPERKLVQVDITLVISAAADR